MMLRSVIAQYHRRGRSLGRRDFSSSGDVVELTGSVMETLLSYGAGLTFGIGSTALFGRIFGCSISGDAEEIEKRWKTKQLELDQLERNLEQDEKYCREILKEIAALKGELKSV